jgi:hypothetical protein
MLLLTMTQHQRHDVEQHDAAHAFQQTYRLFPLLELRVPDRKENHLAVPGVSV